MRFARLYLLAAVVAAFLVVAATALATPMAGTLLRDPRRLQRSRSRRPIRPGGINRRPTTGRSSAAITCRTGTPRSTRSRLRTSRS